MPGSRRDFLSWSATGLASAAALHLLARDAGASPEPHHAPKAKRAIQISLVGGMSHIDSFDYKPQLAERHGKPLGGAAKPDVFFGQVGLLRRPDWEFKRRGQSGLWVSELFPHMAGVADDLTVINSMTADSANHTPALFVLNSGFQFNGYPALGSWLSYGLGSEADDLPAFVVLPDGRGEANGAASNWSSGFLPAQHQGVVFRGGDAPVRDLFPERTVPAAEEKDSRAALEKLNALHLDRTGGESDLAARINSYALAAKMQLAVPAVADLSKEPAKLKALYGFDDPLTADCGRRCLLARRLLERGVRFVQIYSGGPIAGAPRTSWDAHENVKENHGAEAARIDRPVAALLQDLKRRDMLKDTLVIFTTEFGRTPFTQSAGNVVGTGRDHNKYGFTCWLAGAGLKPGTAFGATDEIGWKVAEHPVAWYDFHATVLHLLGLDHEKLTYYHNGIKRRLTNVHGEVVKGILA
ncbi:DUF1501 domain-containing protein [Frigoriglobus tundricola]|uniref:Uncharacterized DUF1501 protein, type 1 n=1 Tax=Frigoriglobus tundricola TaxID=2774151 RepID=A0A6M5YK11_9BACT|nr:DUF1501 domain-containing protein [Frigoriglobus tundricola]QJW94328.1 Uncharacterized DUF1501 protein, type 1 [Frigoriglobus tundricola]